MKLRFPAISKRWLLLALPLGIAFALAGGCSVVLPILGYPPQALRRSPPPGHSANAKAEFEAAPEFRLKATTGAEAADFALTKTSRVLVVFYRGHW